MHKIITLLLLVIGFTSRAQLQTVSKSVTQQIACTPATALVVYAEKTAVTVTGWSNNYMEAHISFTASHSNKDLATRELAYMQYAIVKEPNLVELRNMFKLPVNTDHIYSKLQVKMELLVPAKTRVHVTNKYGDVQVTQLLGNIQVELSYGNMRLTDLAGAVQLRTNYSDVKGDNLRATTLRCTDEQSSIKLELESGDYTFNSKNGTIDLSLKKIQALSIQSTRSDITIRPQRFDACRYKINTTAGILNLPGKYENLVTKKGNRSSFTSSGAAAMPLLDITTNYNSITIK